MAGAEGSKPPPGLRRRGGLFIESVEIEWLNMVHFDRVAGYAPKATPWPTRFRIVPGAKDAHPSDNKKIAPSDPICTGRGDPNQIFAYVRSCERSRTKSFLRVPDSP